MQYTSINIKLIETKSAMTLYRLAELLLLSLPHQDYVNFELDFLTLHGNITERRYKLIYISEINMSEKG